MKRRPIKLKMTSDHTTVLKHGEPFVLVDAEAGACVRLPIETDFDPELILAGVENGTVQVSYAEDDDDKNMLTIVREDGGNLEMMHGHHSNNLGHAEFWVFNPDACTDPSQL